MMGPVPGTQQSRIWARVIGCITPGFVDVILGAGVGMLDGGVRTQIPIDLVPFALRTPNTEFVVVVDHQAHQFLAVEPLE
jgi:hypothetical protein